MTRFILIRHGETLWTEQKRYQGWSDTELSSKGEESIRLISKMLLKSWKIDRLYSSPLKRAYRSSQIIASHLKVRPAVDQRLKEMNFGMWEGKSAAELIAAKDKSFLAWMKKGTIHPPKGETFLSLKKRTQAFLSECVKKYPDQTIGVVSHGGTIRMMLLNALRFPEGNFFSFQIDPASFTVLDIPSKGTAKLICLNMKGNKWDRR